MVFTACNKDTDPPAPVIPDPTGVYNLTSAELVDPDPLILLNVPDGAGGIIPEVSIPAGPATIPQITPIVGAALAAVPCANPASYASFELELKEDKSIIFHCVDEDVHLDVGKWDILKDTDDNYTILSLALTLPDVPFPVVLLIEDLVITTAQLTGTAVNYPMKKDLAKDFAALGNQQFLTTKMILAKKP